MLGTTRGETFDPGLQDLSTFDLSQLRNPFSPSSALPSLGVRMPTPTVSCEALDQTEDWSKNLAIEVTTTQEVCPYEQCKGISFSRTCDLNTHNRRKHNRPYHCPIKDCDSRGFSSPSELSRHVTALHGSHSLFCTIRGCNRAEDAPNKKTFKRQDHLDEHMRRMHPKPGDPNTASLSRSPSTGPHSPAAILPPVPLTTPKRRYDNPLPAEQIEVPAKKTKTEDPKFQQLLADSSKLRETEAREVLELKLRVKRLEENNELLMRIIDRMSKCKV